MRLYAGTAWFLCEQTKAENWQTSTTVIMQSHRVKRATEYMASVSVSMTIMESVVANCIAQSFWQVG